MTGHDTHNILQFAERAQFVLRQALPEDVMDILRWRNDPYVCSMSKQNEPVSEVNHRIWYSQAVNDPNRLLLIGLLKGQKAGIVRFDLQQTALWKVSITLAVEARGLGLGQMFLKMALERLYIANAAVAVLAEVKSTNAPSLSIFQALGFIREGEDGELVRFVLPRASDLQCL